VIPQKSKTHWDYCNNWGAGRRC